MIHKQKYIKTKDGRIIVFSDLQQHKEFKHFNPVSAGFVSIGIKKDPDGYQILDCSCYGESVSLDLKVDENDELLVRRQILGLID